MNNIKTWVYSLVAAFIGSGATTALGSIGLIVAHASGVDVPVLNVHAMLILFASGGLPAVLLYLAKNPLPAETTSTLTVTSTTTTPPQSPFTPRAINLPEDPKV